MRTTHFAGALCATLLASTASAQIVSEVAAPTVSTTYIDMDAVGPAGVTTVAAINAAGVPSPAAISNILLTNSTAAQGVYNTNPTCVRALGLTPGGTTLELGDAPSFVFDAYNAQIDLGGPSTEFGFGMGDWVGPAIIDFYLGGALQTSFTSSSYTTCDNKYYQMTGGTFDRVDIRASTTGGNWCITEFEIQLLDGVFPAFSATPTIGSSPLTVQFTDSSFSSPNAIQTWAWDFENDGTVDSTVQNPSFVYTGACSTFDVSLTVNDAAGRSGTLVKTDYITTDPQDATFSATPQTGCAPLTVQFTPTAAGASSYAWDFDNDGTVDSNAPNPTHTYSVSNQIFDVSLTTTNSCGASATHVETGFIRTVGALSTLYGANNGGSAGGAVYFDVTVTNGIRISGFETNYDAPVGSPVGIQVYTAPGGRVAAGMGSNANWTMVGQDNGNAVSAGLDQPTAIDLATPFDLLPGVYGVALIAVGDGHRYTNGTGANQMFADSNLQIDLGNADNTPFAGGAFSPRVWNGGILYCLGCDGRFANFGAGCNDLGGSQFTLGGSGCPDLGDTFTLTLDSPTVGAGAVTWLLMGLSNQNWLGITLPLDLGLFGAGAGCNVYTSHDLIIGPNSFVGTQFSLSGTVPNDPTITGVPNHWQGYQFDPQLSTRLPVATTNGMTVQIGRASCRERV